MSAYRDEFVIKKRIDQTTKGQQTEKLIATGLLRNNHQNADINVADI